MNYRTVVGVAALVLLFPASESEAAERLPSYKFTTLYSAAHRLLPDIPKSGTASRREPGYSQPPTRPVLGALLDRTRWQDRLPWWREEAIERGTLPPFDQESTFERSLESGRAYDEALRHLRGSEGGRDVPYAAPITRAEKSNPEIAAVLWQRGESQAGRGPGAQGHPALPKPGPTERYKGFTLIGSGYPDVDNELFFATLKSAIDMAMGLPPYLRDLVRRIDTAAYHPPTSLRQVTGAILDIDAVYVIADRREKAPVIFYGSMAESSPQRVALSLIGAGVMAARHERLITLFQSPGRAARRERDERLASVSEISQGLVNEAECELQTILYRAEQSLGATSAQRRARLRLLQQRKCG